VCAPPPASRRVPETAVPTEGRGSRAPVSRPPAAIILGKTNMHEFAYGATLGAHAISARYTIRGIPPISPGAHPAGRLPPVGGPNSATVAMGTLQTRTGLKVDHTFQHEGFDVPYPANYYNDHSFETPGQLVLQRFPARIRLRPDPEVAGPTAIAENPHSLGHEGQRTSASALNETLQPAINQISSTPYWSKFGITSIVQKTALNCRNQGTPGTTANRLSNAARSGSVPARRPATGSSPIRFSWTHGKHTRKGGRQSVARPPPMTFRPTPRAISPLPTTRRRPHQHLRRGRTWSLGPACHHPPTRLTPIRPYLAANRTSRPLSQDDWKVLPRLTLNLGLRLGAQHPLRSITVAGRRRAGRSRRQSPGTGFAQVWPPSTGSSVPLTRRAANPCLPRPRRG